MTVDILNKEGHAVGSVELPEEIFGIEPNVALMHQSVKMYLANQRQGTSKTKDRHEVRGGGRKPWRQKGRGTARAGSIRSGVWVGGGNIHGPNPRDYTQKMPRKMRQIARRSALALKAQQQELLVVDDLVMSEIKTKPFAAMLGAIGAQGRKALVLTNGRNEIVIRSGRNIPKCSVMEATTASTYDILNNQVLVLERGSLERLIEQLRAE